MVLFSREPRKVHRQVMKKADVTKVIDQYGDLFRSHGFKKKRPAIYMREDNFKLQIIFDKWGWSEDEGWGFTVRLFDMNNPADDLGNIHPDDTLELMPAYFFENGAISSEIIDNIYTKKESKLKEHFVEYGWYKFSNEDNLNRVLEATLPIILAEAAKWRK